MSVTLQLFLISLNIPFVQDLKREFVTELIYPAVQANAIYEVREWHLLLLHMNLFFSLSKKNVYLLGTSLARPVIARGMMSVAEKEQCEYVSDLMQLSVSLSSLPS